MITEELSIDQRQWVFETIDGLDSSLVKKISKLRIESSQRNFYRIFDDKETSYILMIVPDGIEESIESFCRKSEFLSSMDVKVPKVLSRNNDLGLLIVEDFGDNLYQFNLSKENADEYYKSAIDQIIKIQESELNRSIFNEFDQNVFDQNWYMFQESFLEKLLHNKVSPETVKILKNKYNQVCKEIDNHLKVICHYDFECRNIIFLESKEAGILDFQDAMIGSIGLDLASLFKDLYFFWPDKKIISWYEYFLKNSNLAKNNDIFLSDLIKMIDYSSIQRQFRILGKLSEVYLNLGRNNRLKDFPVLANYLINTSKKYKEINEIGACINSFLPILNKTIKELS